MTRTFNTSFSCLRDIILGSISEPSTLRFEICLATATWADQYLASLLKAASTIATLASVWPAALNSKPASAGACRRGQMTSGGTLWCLFWCNAPSGRHSTPSGL